MLTLPEGTLPPLPSDYINKKKDFQESNHSSTMVEQIRNIIMKSSSLNNYIEKEKKVEESQMIYRNHNTSLPNSAAADAAAAIFQAYSLFNGRNN
jgi:hypothetical protein